MSLSSVRFQEVHALLSRLIFQGEPQKPVLVTRKRTEQFVLLPSPLLRQLCELLHDYPLSLRPIGITKFRKGILSFERTCEMFKQDGQYLADALLILIHHAPKGALFRYERYEALLAFLRSKGVGVDAFTCNAQIDESLRVLPMAAAIQRFSGLPAQFADEQATSGLSLPVVVSHDHTPVLAVFPWVLCKSLMQELVSRELSEPLQKLMVWWQTSHADGAGTAHEQVIQTSPVSVLIHIGDKEVTVHSLDEFDRLALVVLVSRLINEQDIEQIDSFILETVDLLVPEPEEREKLRSFVFWNPAFFTDPYEHVYQHVRSLFEEQWEDIQAQVKSIREEGDNDPGATQAVEE